MDEARTSEETSRGQGPAPGPADSASSNATSPPDLRETLPATALDAMPVAILLLDRHGTVIATGDAWRDVDAAAGAPERIAAGIGSDYLETCDSAARAGDTAAAATAAALRDILAGRRRRFAQTAPRRAPDGGERFVQLLAVAAAPEVEGRPAGVTVVQLDVTERIRGERTRAAREAQLRLLVEQAPAAIAMFDTQMRYIAASRRFLADYGLDGQVASADGLVGRSHYDLFPEIPERWRVIHRRVLGGEVLSAEEDTFARPDGRTDWVRWTMAPWHQADGGIGGAMLFAEVVTARREAETALAESEGRMRLAQHAAGIGVFDWDVPSGRVVWNEELHRIFGVAPGAFDGTFSGATRHFVPDDLQRILAEVTETTRQRTGMMDFAFRMRRPDGTVRHIEGSGSLDYDADGALRRMVGVNIDVTERKRAEEALAENVARQAFLLRLSDALRTAGDAAAAQAIACRMLGERLGADRCYFADIHAPDGFAVIRPGHARPGLPSIEGRVALADFAEVTAMLASGAPVAFADTEAAPTLSRALRAACGRLGMRSFASAPLLQAGRLVWTLNVTAASPRTWAEPELDLLKEVADRCWEAAERARAGQELRASEAQLRAIVEAVPDALVLIDEAGLIEVFSAAAERMYGWTAAEAVGRNVSMLMPSPDREAHDAHLARYRRTGESRVLGRPCIFQGLRRDGSVFPKELQVSEIEIGGRRRFLGFSRDISEREATEARLREMQAELLHVSRLGDAGAMTSALAHELNQPLTAVMGSVRAAQRFLASGRPTAGMEAREALDLAAEAALRAGRIVSRLREFISRGDADHRLEQLPDLIRDAATLALAGAAQQGITASFRLAADLPPVLVDRVQIQQVIVNLLRNAVEAMQSGPDGVAARADRPREIVMSAALRDDGAVEVTVADSGPGLAPAVAERLFTPFLTTKPQGMGVGLSICRSIIEAHGGRLWAESVPGSGAAFHFTLPVMRANGDE